MPRQHDPDISRSIVNYVTAAVINGKLNRPTPADPTNWTTVTQWETTKAVWAGIALHWRARVTQDWGW